MVITNLVIAGGSLKGIAMLGSISCLLENKHIILDEIKTIVGTSVGSLLGFLLVIGYTIEEILQLIMETDFVSLKKLSLLNLFTCYGLDDGSRIFYKIISIMEYKNIDSNITFEELYKITNKKLTIVCTCLNECKPYYFNYISFPEVKVIDALLASMSIPFLLSHVKINNKIFVDGCILENFPLSQCLGEEENTIGIKTSGIDISEFININNFNKYIKTIISCVSYKIENDYMKDKQGFKNIITLTIDNDNSTNICMSKDDRKLLYENGYNQTTREQLLLKNRHYGL